MRDVAAIIDVRLDRAYELARTGVLPGVVRIGRQIRVNPDQLQRFIENGGAPVKSESSRDR
jgi:hypothetical protein